MTWAGAAFVAIGPSGHEAQQPAVERSLERRLVRPKEHAVSGNQRVTLTNDADADAAFIPTGTST